MMESYKEISSAKYYSFEGANIAIIVTYSNGETWSAPMSIDNTDYAEIMRQVAAGTLTIADAD